MFCVAFLEGSAKQDLEPIISTSSAFFIKSIEIKICKLPLGSATNVMLFFRSKGVATSLLRKNRKKKTLNLQHYLPLISEYKVIDKNKKINDRKRHISEPTNLRLSFNLHDSDKQYICLKANILLFCFLEDNQRLLQRRTAKKATKSEIMIKLASLIGVLTILIVNHC